MTMAQVIPKAKGGFPSFAWRYFVRCLFQDNLFPALLGKVSPCKDILG